MRVLNLFNWKLSDIEKELKTIKNQCFDTIQISTIQPLKDELVWDWWNSYIVRSYNIGNHFGSKDELIKLCSIAKLYELKIITEIIPVFFLENSNTNLIGKVNTYLLGIKNIPKFTIKEEIEIYYFLEQLINYGVSGVCYNFNQLEFNSNNTEFFDNVKHFLANKEAFFAHHSIVNKNIIECVESSYSYFDYNFGATYIFSSKKITNQYQLLCNNSENTMYFARPFDYEWKSQEIKDANSKIYIKK